MNWSLLPYGAYVAFAFSCILFGGLAYRQVIDSLELRASKTGEDLELFFSAPGALYSVVGILLFVPLAWLCYGYGEPSIWRYALPLIVLSQVLQLGARVYFQRLRLRTRALVVRYVLRSRITYIMYDHIVEVRTRRLPFWTVVTITSDDTSETTFRIFRFSEAVLLQKLHSLTGVASSTTYS
ncbi:MAG: hypothetical protein FJ211_03215 [Ignavibacteria bacterium]|nr:hypothetical protein [Ignavibacteria bacterium]